MRKGKRRLNHLVNRTVVFKTSRCFARYLLAIQAKALKMKKVMFILEMKQSTCLIIA